MKLKKLDALKVYKAFKDFRTYAYLVIDKMPHWLKNSEGVICMREIKECVISISVLARSRDAAEKVEAINMFLAHIDCVYDSIDFFAEPQVKGLSSKQVAHLYFLMDEIEGQLSRLRKYLSVSDEVQKD